MKVACSIPELHDKFEEFARAPETLTPIMEWLSDCQRANAAKLEIIKNGKYRRPHKLVPRLLEHKIYAMRYRSPKILVELGVEAIAAHTVLAFEHKAWLMPYID